MVSEFAGEKLAMMTMPFISGPSCSFTLVMPSPTIAPPNILALSPTSLAARTTQTVSGG